MTPFLTALTEAIYTERRTTAWPQRLELAPDLHARFQREARAALQDLAVVPVLVGSIAGVPVIQRDSVGAAMVRADGMRVPITVPA